MIKKEGGGWGGGIQRINRWEQNIEAVIVSLAAQCGAGRAGAEFLRGGWGWEMPRNHLFWDRAGSEPLAGIAWVHSASLETAGDLKVLSTWHL